MVPPFTGVATNVTEVPSQTGFEDGESEIPTGGPGVTIIVIELEVAGLLEVQTVLEEVNIHVTTSPVAGM